MQRVIASFLFIPLLLSSFYSSIFIVIYPVFLIVTLLIALPLFLACHHLRWLNWWHAVIVGLICAAVGIYIDIGSNPVRAEIYGPASAILFAGLGIAGGFLFWWFALYRNPHFPEIPRRIPSNMLILIPIAVIGGIAYSKVTPFDVQGRLLMSSKASIQSALKDSTAQIRLPSGKVVSAKITDDSQIPNLPYVCVQLMGRNSLTSDNDYYWVSYFLDKPFVNYDKC